MKPGSLLFYFAYLHPILAGIVLLVGVKTLGLGLKLRKGRQNQIEMDRAGLKQRHKRHAKMFVVFFMASYVFGLMSQFFFRKAPLFRSAHAYFASISLILVIIGVSYATKMLKTKPIDPDLREMHAFCFALSIFFALGIVVMGLTLLP